jgi:hypothetical protein
MTPEEYFDPIDPGETYEEDAIAKNNFTWEYLDLPREALKWSMERRTGTVDDRTIYTHYMKEGRSWMTHRVDPGGYEEMIHVTQFDERTYHLIRTMKLGKSGRWAVSLNSVFGNQDDGSEIEQNFNQPWTYEIAREYCGLPSTFFAIEDEQPPERSGDSTETL